MEALAGTRGVAPALADGLLPMHLTEPWEGEKSRRRRAPGKQRPPAALCKDCKRAQPRVRVQGSTALCRAMLERTRQVPTRSGLSRSPPPVISWRPGLRALSPGQVPEEASPQPPTASTGARGPFSPPHGSPHWAVSECATQEAPASSLSSTQLGAQRLWSSEPRSPHLLLHGTRREAAPTQPSRPNRPPDRRMVPGDPWRQCRASLPAPSPRWPRP